MVKVSKVKDNIYQIRIMDREETNFHATLYPAKDGVSYSAYLVLDEKITLIDTYEIKYHNEVKTYLDEILQGRDIDILILQHVEPDHSESFRKIYEMYPNIKCYCSTKGKSELMLNFLFDYEFTPVKTGETLNTGKYTYEFFETPMVHWPDNMWSYLAEEKILFSNDGFGQLLTDDVLYDEEIPLEKLLAFAKEYYTNIIFPNNMAVPGVLDKFASKNWDIEIIATGHGIMLKKYIQEMYKLYDDLAHEKKDHTAVIVYETIWGNTKQEAYTIKKALENHGVQSSIYQLSESRISEVIDDVATASYLFLGTGNQNSCMIPIVADFVERLRSLKARKTKIAIFGAYGWNKLPFDEVIRRLEDAKYTVYPTPLLTHFKESSSDVDLADAFIKDYIENLM